MARKKIVNLSEHYLGNKSFKESNANTKNRFLDEVVRRYVREANKKYVSEDGYVLSVDYDFYAGELLKSTEISVSQYSEWRLCPVRIDGRYRRADPEGRVTIGSLVNTLFSCRLDYPPFGSLSKVTMVFKSNGLGELNQVTLTTNLEDIRDAGINYNIPGFIRMITHEDCRQLRNAIVPFVSGSEPCESLIRRLASILGHDVQLEPKQKIIKTVEAIETKRK